VTASGKYRSQELANKVIAFSISYQRDNLLARGMGLEHLRELLLRLARLFLRCGADLAYAGYWKEADDNFTYDLLRLISAEQEDNSLGGPDTSLRIGKLYNHSAWPAYLDITPRIEAQWINCCRIIRITQQQAGIADEDVVADNKRHYRSARTALNAAVTLSAMRRLSMHAIPIEMPDAPSETAPRIDARVLLGGKADGYSGFVPGIFEEALLTLREKCPLYILGGFGGAAGILAEAILKNDPPRPKELTAAWHIERNQALVRLLESADRFGLPTDCRSTEATLDELFPLLEEARKSPSAVLGTGLTDDETRELLETRSVANAVHLVHRGLLAGP